jgi:hypothetical protein
MPTEIDCALAAAAQSAPSARSLLIPSRLRNADLPVQKPLSFNYAVRQISCIIQHKKAIMFHSR